MLRSVGERQPEWMPLSLLESRTWQFFQRQKKKMKDGMGIFGNPLTRTITCLFGIYIEVIFFSKSKKKVHVID